MLTGGTLFSGIGAPECAAPWLDWRWCAEIDPFASAVHAARFPGAPNLGDVTEIDSDAVEPVDLIVFGSPCQSFSVAGKRLGLDDPRGNLALVGLRLIGKLRPGWVVWENVPGVLSSDGGRDFGAFLGLLGECGYGFAYRVLDAQHFGVPQRRRRVFVVGYFGDWRPAAAVLFEPESLRGDPAPRREAGQGTAPSLTACAETERKHGYGWGQQEAESDGFLIAFGGNRQSGALDVATAINAHGGPHGRLDFESETFVAYDITGTGPGVRTGASQTEAHTMLRSRVPGTSEGITTTVIAQAFALGSHAGAAAVAFKTDQEPEAHGDIAPTLQQPSPSGGGQPTAVMSGMSVRRLTPRECERLQGFPDDFTLIRYRGKPAADGPRYRALGNSMAVPVLRWLLGRIEAFEDTV